MHQRITLEELNNVVRLNLNSITGWQPIILLGAPGQAKTHYCKNVLRQLYAESLGLGVDDIGFVVERPARRDAVEMAGVGVPYKQGNGKLALEFSKPPMIKQIEESGRNYGIILIDEIAAARDAEQKVLRDVFDKDEHQIGGYDLPAGWIVIGTGNRAHDKAGSGRLMAHLINVCLVFEVEFSFTGWKNWAQAHNVNPLAIDCAEAHHDNGFFADRVPAEDGAFCTPRSLTRAAAHLDSIMADPDFTGFLSPLHERMLAANVGPAAANLLAQWAAQHDKVPTAAEVLADPEGAKVPDQTGFQMIAANIAMGAVEDARSAVAVLHYIVRLRSDLQVSLGVKLMKISTRNGWTVTDPLASAFIAKFHELLPLAVQD